MNREMTEDTRRAIQIIQPICDALGIEVDADERMLYMDGTGIGISCNSTYATMMEALGYIFLQHYPAFRRAPIDGHLSKDIRRYWISPAALKKLKGEWDD